MKHHHLYHILALCLALCMLFSASIFATEAPGEAEGAEGPVEEIPSDPTDTYEFPNDWSRNALVFAVKNHVLAGDQNRSLNPDKNITRAEMAAILVRMLAASGKADLSSFKDVNAADWYYAELSAAYAAGIFSGTSASTMEPNAPLTREQAIVVLTRAFGIADTDCTAYTKFSDAGNISAYARDAVSAMTKQHLLSGYADGGVHPQSNITRAEIAQLIFNLFDCIADAPEDIPAAGRVLYRGVQSLPDSFRLDGSLVIGQPYAGTLSPSDWEISGTLSVRSSGTVTADFSNLKTAQLVFAPTAADVNSCKLSGAPDTTFIGGTVGLTGDVKTLTVLNGNSTFNGSCDDLVLRDNAYLIMTGNAANGITAKSGSALVLKGNTPSIDAGTTVGISIYGDVGSISLGAKCNLHCFGKLDSISIGSNCSVILEKDIDSIDLTANNIHLTVNGRVEKLRATGKNTLIDGEGRVGELSFYSTTTFTVACDETFDLWQEEYQHDYDAALSTVKTLKIPCIAQSNTTLYQNNGSGYLGTIAKGETVYNLYWPDGPYMYVSTASGQRGWVNRYSFFIDKEHMSFDGKLDYSAGTKDGFVNLMGYSSPTGYLIWVSRYTQKVIIYSGSKGNWKAIKTFPCASGSAYTPTPEGIYDIYAKTWMWDFNAYIVNNVSLFRGGIAFHSYLLNYDYSDYYSELGRPMSHGCIRMNPTDAAYIYNGIPQTTTVVVY